MGYVYSYHGGNVDSYSASTSDHSKGGKEEEALTCLMLISRCIGTDGDYKNFQDRQKN